MPDRLRYGLGVILLLAVALASGGFAILQGLELRDALHARPACLMAGTGMSTAVLPP